MPVKGERTTFGLRVGIGDVTATSAQNGAGKQDLLTLIEKAINLKEDSCEELEEE